MLVMGSQIIEHCICILSRFCKYLINLYFFALLKISHVVGCYAESTRMLHVCLFLIVMLRLQDPCNISLDRMAMLIDWC